MRPGRAGRGGKRKEVVDGRGNFERALVAVALDPVDPLRVYRTRTHDPSDLFLKRSNPRSLRPGMVVMVDDRLLSAQLLDRSGESSLELVVVVAVEDVVLAIVLVLDHRFYLPEACRKVAPCRRTICAGPVCISTPFQVDFAELLPVVPDVLIDQCLQAGAVGSGL